MNNAAAAGGGKGEEIESFRRSATPRHRGIPISRVFGSRNIFVVSLPPLMYLLSCECQRCDTEEYEVKQ